MRYILAFAACLAAAPVVAQETPILERECMEAISIIGYGPHDFHTGVLTGIVIGYGVATGRSQNEAEAATAQVAIECRRNPGMTFRNALAVLDQD